MKRTTCALLTVMALMAPALWGVAEHPEQAAAPVVETLPDQIPASAIGPIYTPAFLLDIIVGVPYACEENLACTRDLDCLIFWGQPSGVCVNPSGTPCGGTCC